MTPTEKAAKYFVDKFRSYVGYHEKATNSQLEDFTANSGSHNYNRFAAAIDALRAQGYNVYNGKKNIGDPGEWCDISFDEVQIECWGVETAQKMLYQPWNSCGAGCCYSADYYRAAGAWYTTPMIGDQIFYGKKGDETHTGAVYDMDDIYVYTVEGNYGDQVSERKVNRNDSSISGYGRPNYALVADRFKEPEPIPPAADYITAEQCDKMIADICGKWIKDIKDVPDKAVSDIARILLDMEAVDGGTPYSVNPDDIRLPYNILRAIIISVRYADSRIKTFESKFKGISEAFKND